MLCGNARLQEAWEHERKTSPDTPWRFPTVATTLNLDSLKPFPRESGIESSENVLHLMNKGHNIDTYQAKKFFTNNSMEAYQHQYSNKSSAKVQRHKSDKEQQRMTDYERELRLQKSLSEECEDLGVDEPSTSDLFPEADLLFDPNHSPSFDQSSQDASCSSKSTYGTSYFRALDASSGSRDLSPVTTESKTSERRKNAAVTPRTRVLKESVKRKLEDVPKSGKLSFDILNQDSVSSNSDSRHSSGHPDSKELKTQNGSKEETPGSSSSSSSNVKMDLDLDSNVNNVASSGDESLTLLGTSATADVTIPSPLSSLISNPLLNTHKYNTYSNKKRLSNKLPQADYSPSWDSAVSERTRSSSDDEESSLGESSQTEDCALTNGLDEGSRLNAGDHCTYMKKDKLQVNARVVLNRADTQAILSNAKHRKAEHMMDDHGEMSDDEHHHASSELDCRSRRSSLRGHVKKDKGCSCCNGSPERPKKKMPKYDNKLKKKLAAKISAKKR